MGLFRATSTFVGWLYFQLRLALSPEAVRFQWRELARRRLKLPPRRVGASVLLVVGQGASAVHLTLEPTRMPRLGLQMRFDIVGRNGFAQTLYPFWRDRVIFEDFLDECAVVALASLDFPGDSQVQLADPGPFGIRTARMDPDAVERLEAARSAHRLQVRLLQKVAAPSPPPARPRNTAILPRVAARWQSSEFESLESLFDLVLTTGRRVAVRIRSDGPDLWVTFWRRPDGGLFVQWGPGEALERESPTGLYERLSAQDLDLKDVRSQMTVRR